MKNAYIIENGDFVTQLAPAQRKAGYEYALREMILAKDLCYFHCSVCVTLDDFLSQNGYGTPVFTNIAFIAFPEFNEQRPKRIDKHDTGYWWSLDEQGMDCRIEALRAAIAITPDE